MAERRDEDTGEEKPVSRDTEGSFGKILKLLDYIAAAGHPLRFSDIQTGTGLAKGTLHRLLKLLLEEDMLAYDEVARGYSVGFRTMRLAHAAWRVSSLTGAALEALDRLSRETHETLHLAALDSYQVLYLDKRQALRAVSMFSSAGKVGPAYCTGVGKAMLSALSADRLAKALEVQTFKRYTANTLTTQDALLDEIATIRGCGYAIDNEEHEPGIICIAKPIVTTDGELFGGLSITGSTHVLTIDRLKGFLPLLEKAASDIAERATIMRVPTL